ncbi:cysteine-rich CWC family protein [Alicyclobacillus fastidiosus]|uniref:Cysteine-rich CWC family protein n=1 Tax=Alicyclobacillus fastidiosus TaxID=392011 RepID=A0ABY6ZC71_9BACL|nr:cysteine-rich CWC family protein [Alicyclobacillus fastidiosus]WAH39716.1 cysteine-rich CWC family protein [Alicyclobacillus fastidiosus]
MSNVCPLCGMDNHCGNVAGKPHGTCWCDKEVFPKEIFEKRPLNQSEKSCICQNCLDKFKQSINSMSLKRGNLK